MVIVGGGRVGTALAKLCEQHRLSTSLVTRTEGKIGENGTEPILVTVRNDDLSGFLASVPQQRRSDLVFVQNGMIRPWLAANGLSENTRGLLYFAVAKRGDPPVPGPPSPFVGAHAPAIVSILETIGLGGRVVSPAAFTQVELEKLIWNCAFGLMCEATGATVGEVVDLHGEELAALVNEMIAVGERELGITADSGLLERCCAYSRDIYAYRGAVKEWVWRNGWFVERSRDLEMPVHSHLLQRLGLDGRTA